MADINGVSFTGSGSPGIHYDVAYSINSSGGYEFTITTYMGYSSSFFGTGYSLIANLKVGTTTLAITLKTTDEGWSGTDKHTATGTLSPGLSTNSRTITFSVSRGDGLGTTGIVEENSDYTVAANQTYTQVSPPTAMTFNPTSDFENSLTVSWSGAKAGTSNPIIEYWLTPQFSNDNSTWTTGDMVKIATSSTSGSYTFDTSGWDYGIYVYFRIRTVGTYSVNGSNMSDAYVSNTIRKLNVTDPTPPWIEIDKSKGSICETVKVSWGTGSAGTNNSVIGYSLRIYQCDTYNGFYSLADTLEYNSSTKSVNITLSSFVTRGKYVEFNIGVIGSYTSDATYSPINSDYIKANYKPNKPTLVLPTSGSTSYNVNPYVKLKCGTDSDTTSQRYYLKCGTTKSNLLSYQAEQFFKVSSGSTAAYTYDEANCASTSLAFSVTTIDAPWGTGNRLSSGEAVKASDILDLRTAVNHMRTYYNLAEKTNWTDTTITPGVTKVKAIHLKEIQTAINDILAIQTELSVVWTTISVGRKIKAAHINQIREIIENL